VGTPAYIYSASSIEEQFGRLSGALASVPHRLHYSVKANGCLAILRLLRELGAGVDVVSGGELHRALLAGFTGPDIVFGGVGKTETELREALRAEVRMINAESLAEVLLIDGIAREMGVIAPLSLRVNPEVTVETAHEYIKTGERGQKFGIPFDEAADVAATALALPSTRLIGLDMHVGSQLTGLDPYEEGVARLLDLYERVLAAGAKDIAVLDVGGGLAVQYSDERPPNLERFGSIMSEAVRDRALDIVVEPGRFLVGNAGVLLTRVLYRKRSGGKEYVITDAGMNDLLRPSHYRAYHRIESVYERTGLSMVDVVGPVCESGDFFALDREMDQVSAGDLLAIQSVGAYGYAMASNYNSRPRAAEVMVRGERFALVTERETYDDLTRRESSAPDWRTV
jgi:diaminopimelate decarboxylase